MAWVAVDANGDEYVHEGKPERVRDENGVFVFWEYEITVEGEWVNMSIELPQGSIEKLIGYKLVPGDEPIELK